MWLLDAAVFLHGNNDAFWLSQGGGKSWWSSGRVIWEAVTAGTVDFLVFISSGQRSHQDENITQLWDHVNPLKDSKCHFRTCQKTWTSGSCRTLPPYLKRANVMSYLCFIKLARNKEVTFRSRLEMSEPAEDYVGVLGCYGDGGSSLWKASLVFSSTSVAKFTWGWAGESLDVAHLTDMAVTLVSAWAEQSNTAVVSSECWCDCDARAGCVKCQTK